MFRLLKIVVFLGLIGCGGVPPEETVLTDELPSEDEALIEDTPEPEASEPLLTEEGEPMPGSYLGVDGQWHPGPLVNRGVMVGRPSYATSDQMAAEAKARAAKKCDCKQRTTVPDDATVAPGQKKPAMPKKPKKLSHRQRLAKFSKIHGQPNGKAAWFGLESHNRKTTSGAMRSTYQFTAAHRSLPYNTVVDVINLYNGRKTRVTINDRTGTSKTRVMVVSQIAATDLQMIEDGLVPVRVIVISRGGRATASR